MVELTCLISAVYITMQLWPICRTSPTHKKLTRREGYLALVMTGMACLSVMLAITVLEMLTRTQVAVIAGMVFLIWVGAYGVED